MARTICLQACPGARMGADDDLCRLCIVKLASAGFFWACPLPVRHTLNPCHPSHRAA